MWKLRLGVLLTSLAACGGGTTSGRPDARGFDAAAPDGDGPDGGGTAPDGGATPDSGATLDAPPDDGCASGPAGDWAGATKFFGRGSGPYQSHGADVTWTLVGTDACVDRYAPSGTAWIDHQGYVCEANFQSSHPIASSDGVFTIDRSTAPPTYAMTGSTSWQHTVDCPDTDPLTVRSAWASYRGVIDGDVFGGGRRQGAEIYWQWRFTRRGAALPPPDDCAEPAEDTWTGTHAVTGPGTDDLVATVTWTRVATEGCVDRFEPGGSATLVINRQDPCTATWIEPGEGPVEPGDGFLEIDRSTNPPTFVSEARVGWDVTVHCAHADGTTDSHASVRGGRWSHYGPLDGAVVAGALVLPLLEEAWRLER
jgi:hypothetical protein